MYNEVKGTDFVLNEIRKLKLRKFSLNYFDNI